MDLIELLKQFLAHRELSALLSVSQLEIFVALARHLKPRIALVPSEAGSAPLSLPLSVHQFFCAAMEAPDVAVKLCWLVLKDYVWELESCEANPKVYLPIFLKHGLPAGIGFRDLLPPTLHCLSRTCQFFDVSRGETVGKVLGKEYVHKAVVFTQDLGPIPVWTVSLFCTACKTRYHHNYYIENEEGFEAKRTYYDAHVPPVIQIADHVFFTSETCEWVVNQMVCAWVSGSNNARVYNELHSPPDCEWDVTFEMKYNHVWDAFILYSLLLHHSEHATILQLPDRAESQAERLSPALMARNDAVVGPGQQDWDHACNLCCRVVKMEDGSPGFIRSFVTDGITMGHPCCGEHNCQKPLPTNRSRYCSEHLEIDQRCCARISGVQCTRLRTDNSRTCELPEHKALETRYTERGRAMFQLKRRLEKLSLSQTHSSVNPAEQRNQEEGFGGDSDDEVEVAIACDSKSEAGNRKLRARFGRNRTHNEELCVGSCGVIIGRATMFGAEAASGVVEFWKTLFPTAASLPQVMWHDNNCTILKMLEANGDEYFAHIALPVDVFHFKCKHKESDTFCSLKCNPARWADLQVDGKWAFNSSAAEQANVWMGGFRAIVREMRSDRYNFFLDEMIKRRNKMVIASLSREGHLPWSIPRDVLLS